MKELSDERKNMRKVFKMSLGIFHLRNNKELTLIGP